MSKNICAILALLPLCLFADRDPQETVVGHFLIKDLEEMSVRYPFHIFAATGYAWSMKAGIRNPDSSFWDQSNEGYNASLGNASFFTFGFGRSFWAMLNVDFNYNFYGTFHYQKRQTSSSGDSGDVRIRYFDLNNQGALMNFSVYPYAIPIGETQMRFIPFAGLGIGVGVNQVTNFHTVGNNTSGVGSTTSTGQPRTTITLAWQGLLGFRLHPKHAILSLDVAYRYYNAGKFLGPSTITSFVDDGEQFTGKPWKGTLQTNQFYISGNISF